MIPSIGFDLDQCLVEAFNLVPFILFFELNLKGLSLENQTLIKKSREIFYELIASSEAKAPHIFRPSLLKLFPSLIKLKKEGKIKHMFIYSNNGHVEILNAIDNILALIMKKSPYSINEHDLILEDGRLHVLTPRIYIGSSCRIDIEPIDNNKFREKSLAGIQACLNETIAAHDLWFVDDSLQHRDLIEKLGTHYINVEPYKMHISNEKIINFFIQSLPKRVFMPNMPLYNTIIPLINKIFFLENPSFYPSGREGQSTLVEKLHNIMIRNTIFKPESSSKGWGIKKIEDDYNVVKKLLSANTQSKDFIQANVNSSYKSPYTERTPLGYKPFYGGNYKGPRGPRGPKDPSNSRAKIVRILRTRRKSRK